MARGKNISIAEKIAIRIGMQKGKTPSEIARYLNRSPQAVHQWIKKQENSADLKQLVLDMGQADE